LPNEARGWPPAALKAEDVEGAVAAHRRRGRGAIVAPKDVDLPGLGRRRWTQRDDGNRDRFLFTHYDSYLNSTGIVIGG
jgi:hypothetical protein